jgi:hypothetical protein
MSDTRTRRIIDISDFHRHPYDFWRYEKDDFELIFSGSSGS